MPSIEIKKELYEEITQFCKFNDIKDVPNFVENILKKGFDMKKYGDSFALFFNKQPEDIVHVIDEPKKEVELDVKQELPVVDETPKEKKRGRKKKVVEEESVVEPIEEPTQDPQPTYVIKEQIPEKPKEKIQVTLKKRDDNYGVYDDI